MINLIFDKTDKGREEIATRKHRLAARQRALLLLIDGKRTADEILQKISGLGLTQQDLTDLIDSDFIQSTAIAEPVIDAAPDAIAPVEPVAVDSEGQLEEKEFHVDAVRSFYTQTIKAMIGLRGFALQLKVDNARTIEELHALRPAYLEGIFKAKGPDIARNLRDQLDQLLYPNQTLPPNTNFPQR